jgi:hypothetical protein
VKRFFLRQGAAPEQAHVLPATGELSSDRDPGGSRSGDADVAGADRPCSSSSALRSI